MIMNSQGEISKLNLNIYVTKVNMNFLVGE